MGSSPIVYKRKVGIFVSSLTFSLFENKRATNSSSRQVGGPARSDKFKFISSAFRDTERLEPILHNVEKRAVVNPLVSIKIF